MKAGIYKYSGILSFIWAGIIFLLCATPGQFIPSVNWLDLLSFDKWVHAGMFFILTSLMFISALKHNKPSTVLFFIFITCVLYGGLLEIMQAKCFSNRSADWQDFAANTVGCIMACLLLKRLRSVLLGFIPGH